MLLACARCGRGRVVVNTVSRVMVCLHCYAATAFSSEESSVIYIPCPGCGAIKAYVLAHREHGWLDVAVLYRLHCRNCGEQRIFAQYSAHGTCGFPSWLEAWNRATSINLIGQPINVG